MTDITPSTPDRDNDKELADYLNGAATKSLEEYKVPEVYNEGTFFPNDQNEKIKIKENKKQQQQQPRGQQEEEDDEKYPNAKEHTVYKYSKDMPLAEEIQLGDNQNVFLQIIDGKPV